MKNYIFYFLLYFLGFGNVCYAQNLDIEELMNKIYTSEYSKKDFRRNKICYVRPPDMQFISKSSSSSKATGFKLNVFKSEGDFIDSLESFKKTFLVEVLFSSITNSKMVVKIELSEASADYYKIDRKLVEYNEKKTIELKFNPRVNKWQFSKIISDQSP